jgi:hypothetical protein
LEREVRILDNLALRIRIAILWLFWDVALVGGIMVLTFLKPDVLEGIMSGEAHVSGLGMKIGPEALVMYAVLVLVPLVMAFLTVTLKYSITRWANIVMGTVAFVVTVIGMYGESADPMAFSTLIWISQIVVGALIIWYAYKWTGKEA